MHRVLVVDDDLGIRLTLQDVLRSAGYDVTVASNADSAQSKMGQVPFAVVITDIYMPGQSGVDLLLTIRRLASDAQVILITGEPTVETAAEAVRAGAVDYLTKPFAKADLLHAVQTAVRIHDLDQERRRLLEENRTHQRELERLVQERTVDLNESNHRLSQALEQVTKAQQQLVQRERLNALGQMVSGIAHDFNNILMPILGLSDFLVTDPATLENRGETLEILKSIRSAAEDARSLVRRLREFYRPDEQLALSPADIRVVLDRVVDLTEPAWRVQPTASGRVIELVRDYTLVPKIFLNEPQMREVLTNLIMNAVDAMPQGGKLTLSTRVVDGCLNVEVRDTGSGMSDEVKARCFEPFFSTKGEHGSGLGLAVCHGIVQRHGGRIQVDSAPGKGTAICILLPLQSPPALPERVPDVEVSAGCLRILVIDDDVWSTEMVSRCLTRDGHRVDTEISGDAGLSRLREHPYDLVVTDKAMPGMSGEEVARRVKERAPDVPVILLTGLGDLLKLMEHPVAGVDFILSKPVTREELRRAVNSVMHRRVRMARG
ncbi:MAG: response regulator [Lentisphaerae bacterium]|nr:response regulator [Lentisphaerota bacterium]